MLLSEIEKDPVSALRRMERVVNDGPPTGLKFTNNVSLETNPWLHMVVSIDRLYCYQYGVEVIGIESPCVTTILGNKSVFVHSDFRNSFFKPDEIDFSVIRGYPTSSSRTIRIKNCDFYIKLHYPTTLGRVDKSLTKEDILNSIDVNALLKKAVERGKVSPLLSFFPEESGRVGKYNETNYYSFTVRSSEPYQKKEKNIEYIVPAFSLYGQDYEAPFDKTLLSQLIHEKKGVGMDYVNSLLIPIVDCYLSLLFYEGLQHEMHSQNFLLGFDKNWNLKAVILRDIESVQKDITIRSDQGLTDQIKSYPSRCLWRGQLNYEEKHSFMFDHKLYDFFIKPLLEKVEYDGIKKKRCLAEISAFVNNKYQIFIHEYFPLNGKWYKFEDVIVSKDIKRRLFLECDNPPLR